MNTTSTRQSTDRIRRLSPKKRLVKLIGRITFSCMSRASSLLRPWSVELIGNSLGSLFYVLSKRYRKVALKNLRAAFANEKTDAEIRSIAKEVFKHFARGSLEFFRLLSLTPEQIGEMIEFEGAEHIDNALAKGNGCIIITAHYGNWELLARKLVLLGYSVNVIARDSDDPGMTGIATRIRETAGYKVFDRDQSLLGVVRGLRNNELLGILPDQNESHGIFVDFFSRPAKTAVGPAIFSLRSGAPLVPVFAARLGRGKYKAVAHPPVQFEPSGDEEKDIHDLTALIQKAIEKEVAANPSQWLWLHDRWKLSSEAPTNGD